MKFMTKDYHRVNMVFVISSGILWFNQRGNLKSGFICFGFLNLILLKMMDIEDESFNEMIHEIRTIAKCSICLNTLENPTELKCKDTFCRSCIEKCLLESKAVCPICQTVIETPLSSCKDEVLDGLLRFVETAVVEAVTEDGIHFVVLPTIINSDDDSIISDEEINEDIASLKRKRSLESNSSNKYVKLDEVTASTSKGTPEMTKKCLRQKPSIKRQHDSVEVPPRTSKHLLNKKGNLEESSNAFDALKQKPEIKCYKNTKKKLAPRFNEEVIDDYLSDEKKKEIIDWLNNVQNKFGIFTQNSNASPCQQNLYLIDDFNLPSVSQMVNLESKCPSAMTLRKSHNRKAKSLNIKRTKKTPIISRQRSQSFSNSNRKGKEQICLNGTNDESKSTVKSKGKTKKTPSPGWSNFSHFKQKGRFPKKLNISKEPSQKTKQNTLIDNDDDAIYLMPTQKTNEELADMHYYAALLEKLIGFVPLLERCRAKKAKLPEDETNEVLKTLTDVYEVLRTVSIGLDEKEICFLDKKMGQTEDKEVQVVSEVTHESIQTENPTNFSQGLDSSKIFVDVALQTSNVVVIDKKVDPVEENDGLSEVLKEFQFETEFLDSIREGTSRKTSVRDNATTSSSKDKAENGSLQNINPQSIDHQNMNHQNMNHQNVNPQNINHQNMNHQNRNPQNINLLNTNASLQNENESLQNKFIEKPNSSNVFAKSDCFANSSRISDENFAFSSAEVLRAANKVALNSKLSKTFPPTATSRKRSHDLDSQIIREHDIMQAEFLNTPISGGLVIEVEGKNREVREVDIGSICLEKRPNRFIRDDLSIVFETNAESPKSTEEGSHRLGLEKSQCLNYEAEQPNMNSKTDSISNPKLSQVLDLPPNSKSTQKIIEHCDALLEKITSKYSDSPSLPTKLDKSDIIIEETERTTPTAEMKEVKKKIQIPVVLPEPKKHCEQNYIEHSNKLIDKATSLFRKIRTPKTQEPVFSSDSLMNTQNLLKIEQDITAFKEKEKTVEIEPTKAQVPELKVLQNILIASPQGNTEGLFSEDIFSDEDVVESTPQKKRKSSRLPDDFLQDLAIDEDLGVIPLNADADDLCVNIPPPPGFGDPTQRNQQTSSIDHENVNKESQGSDQDFNLRTFCSPKEIATLEDEAESAGKPCFDVTMVTSRSPEKLVGYVVRNPLEELKQNTSVCLGHTLPLPLSLSPIRANVRTLNVIEQVQQSKFSPLTILAKEQSKPTTPVTSTPKQKSILSYVKPVASGSGSGIASYSVKAVTSCSVKPCICCTRLNKNQIVAISMMTNKKLATYQSTFSQQVTHVVVNVDDRNCVRDQTIKYILAVATGIWVVSFDWIQECLAKNCIVSEAPYEVLDVTGTEGPKMSRLNRDCKPLLKNFKIHVAPPFISLAEETVKSLVEYTGGDVVFNMGDFNHDDGYIELIVAEARATQEFEIYETWFELYKVVTVDVQWLTTSIGQYKVNSLRPFLLCSDDALEELGFPAELIAEVPLSHTQYTAAN